MWLHEDKLYFLLIKGRVRVVSYGIIVFNCTLIELNKVYQLNTTLFNLKFFLNNT